MSKMLYDYVHIRHLPGWESESFCLRTESVRACESLPCKSSSSFIRYLYSAPPLLLASYCSGQWSLTDRVVLDKG